jgi:hypothetical protein
MAEIDPLTPLWGNCKGKSRTLWSAKLRTSNPDIIHSLEPSGAQNEGALLKRCGVLLSLISVPFCCSVLFCRNVKGDTAASFFGEWQQSYRYKFLALFLWIGSENVRPSAVQWHILHVEKDDQVIRHNNNNTWELGDKREKQMESILVQNISKKLFRGKIFVLFCWLCLVFITLCLLFLYNFVIHQKNWLRYHPLAPCYKRGSIEFFAVFEFPKHHRNCVAYFCRYLAYLDIFSLLICS